VTAAPYPAIVPRAAEQGVRSQNMSVIRAEEIELLSFFEVEPRRLDKDVPWPYNDFLYEVQRGDLSLSFSVAPAYKDVRIILKKDETQLYELNAVGVEDVIYHNDKGREAVEIVINETDRLWLRVKPEIKLTHEIKE
jgi:hypothetical protein